MSDEYFFIICFNDEVFSFYAGDITILSINVPSILKARLKVQILLQAFNLRRRELLK